MANNNQPNIADPKKKTTPGATPGTTRPGMKDEDVSRSLSEAAPLDEEDDLELDATDELEDEDSDLEAGDESDDDLDDEELEASDTDEGTETAVPSRQAKKGSCGC